MTLLLDTHAWFWAIEAPENLGPQCRVALESPDNELFVATISTVEFGQLQASQRIEFKGTLESWVRRGTEALGLQTVTLSQAIALLAYALPGRFHKDPVDRLLVATAIHHGFMIVTADDRILTYPHVMAMDARR